MRRFFLQILFCLVVLSCQQTVKKPKNLLSKEEMISILTDIYLYKQNMNSSVPLDKDKIFEIYVSIFKIHNTSKEQFQESYQYYYVNSTTLQNIYEEVLKNLKNKLDKNQQSLLKY